MIITDKIIQHEWQQFIQTIQTLSQKFEEQMSNLTNSSITKIKNVEQQSIQTGQKAMGIVQSLNTEVAKQLDMFRKIGSSLEFSALIKATRGQYVDADELKHPVIRAIDIMISRLDSITNNVTKNQLQKARNSLQSESLIFS